MWRRISLYILLCRMRFCFGIPMSFYAAALSMYKAIHGGTRGNRMQLPFDNSLSNLVARSQSWSLRNTGLANQRIKANEYIYIYYAFCSRYVFTDRAYAPELVIQQPQCLTSMTEMQEGIPNILIPSSPCSECQEPLNRAGSISGMSVWGTKSAGTKC